MNGTGEREGLEPVALPSLKVLGRRFAALRDQEGVSLEEAARRIEAGTDAIEDFERHGAVSADNLIRLLEGYSLGADLETAFLIHPKAGLPRTVGEVMESWSSGAIDTPTAIARGGFDGFADLLEATIANDVPLRTELTPTEVRQAATFVRLMRGD